MGAVAHRRPVRHLGADAIRCAAPLPLRPPTRPPEALSRSPMRRPAKPPVGAQRASYAPRRPVRAQHPPSAGGRWGIAVTPEGPGARAAADNTPGQGPRIGSCRPTLLPWLGSACHDRARIKTVRFDDGGHDKDVLVRGVPGSPLSSYN